jgi:hypothetical protein
MVSSKDIQAAKKVCAGHRQFFKELLDHLYAQAAEAGRYPSPERMIFDQLLPLVEVAILRDQPPQPPDQDFTDLQVRLGLRIYRQLFDDAVAAYFRYRPELKIKIGAPLTDAITDEAFQLQQQHKNNPQIAAELNKRHANEPNWKPVTPDGIRKRLKRRSERQEPHPDKP